MVPNWAKFQQYRKRSRRGVPPWIKLYTELNSRDDWCNLSLAARGLLVTIWIEYARTGGKLTVRQALHKAPASHRQSLLESLSDAGFIHICANAEEVLRTSLYSDDAPRKKGAAASLSQSRSSRDPQALEHLAELTQKVWGPSNG